MVMIKWLKQLLDRGADIESYSKPTQQSKKDREQAVQYRLTHGKNRCFNSQCKKVEDTLGDYKSCSACKHVFYCSREFQRGDWKMHKKV